MCLEIGLFKVVQSNPIVVQSAIFSLMTTRHQGKNPTKTQQSPGSITEEILDGHEEGHDQSYDLQENGPCQCQRPTGRILAKPGMAA